jgi:hypothetical protein
LLASSIKLGTLSYFIQKSLQWLYPGHRLCNFLVAEVCLDQVPVSSCMCIHTIMCRITLGPIIQNEC